MSFNLETTFLSMPTDISLDANAWVDDESGLSDFEFRADSFDQHMLRGAGSVRDGRFKLNVETAGETFPVEFPIGEDLLVRGNFGATSMNLPVLEIGDVLYVDAFDPLTLTKGTARIECIGVDTLEFNGEEMATKILETEMNGITTKTWVNLNEEVMRIETPVGLVLKRMTQAEALAEMPQRDAEGLIQSVAVRPTGERPFRGAERMRIRMTNLPSSAAIPSDEIQREVESGIFEIARPSEPLTNAPTDTTPVDAYRSGDPFVQVDHPRIVSALDTISSGPDHPWNISKQIYRWVYENIEKVPVLSFPSALDVLQSGEGDCNEHTVLFTALARTADIPTRIAIGLVWSDDLEGFYYHAWPEVHVGRWIPMDPTLGQPIADATHIRLLHGSIDQWPRLVPYVGQVEIEVLEVE
jgi:hypothetical protein